MRPIVFLALVAPATAFGAEQCFYDSGTYGDLTVTRSGVCGVAFTNYFPGVGISFTNVDTTCTFTFDHPVDGATMRVLMEGHSNDGSTYGENAAFYLDGIQYLVTTPDIDNSAPAVRDPLVATLGSVSSSGPYGTGTVHFTAAGATSEIEIEHDTLFGSPNGTVYAVCVDDGMVVVDSDSDGTPDTADCAPTDPAVHPGATELCNAVDDDCDLAVDDGLTSYSNYTDADADGYGDPATEAPDCAQVSGTVENGADCDDADASINPDGVEVCDGVDQDCDSVVDEGVDSTFYADADADGFGDAATSAAACAAPSGFVADATDCDDDAASVFPGAEEVCDGVDQDCDTEVDEGVQTTFYADQDADGYGAAALPVDACSAPNGYVSDSTDCDDDVAAVNPAAVELCNGTDDDCDGAIDDGVTTIWFADVDADGFGDPDGAIAACTQPNGAVSDSTDCDDADADVNTDGTEVCDGIDQDCDGDVDDGVATEFFADLGGDGYGGPSAIQACSAPEGYLALGGDCDDFDLDTHPSAPESCIEPVDRNCDGVVGRVDLDADGFAACEECDDLDADVNPNGTELCNGIDDDCDGTTDVGAEDASNWYADADDDGFTDPDDGVLACDAPEGYLAESSDDDCDDTDADINPDAADEPGDGIDQDCDGADAEVEDTDVQDTDVEDTDVPDTDLPDTDVEDTDTDGGCGCNKGQSGAWVAILGLAGLFARRRRNA